MASTKYRPHIDGLRAVAVLLVIFHHLGDRAGISGGYVGVDVFLVISGYLITGIVKSEIEAGGFDFGRFYKRRVVRLAPAYFTVLTTTTLAALLWMLPAELMAYAKSVIASSLLLANFHMWKEVGGYFGGDGGVVPLLHLWSLAVEEQFYLFWPVVMLLYQRIFQGRWALPFLVVATVAFTIGSQWGVVNFPAAAYYLLPTRAFELLVGAVLAYLPLSTLDWKWKTLASLVGVVLITYSGFSYWAETPFPGYSAVAPVLGAAILLRWCQGTVFGDVLSTPTATFVGRISYPAYLWHWPIIVFLNINDIEISFLVGSGVMCATLTLSWLTFHWIELPARKCLAWTPKRVLIAGAVMPMLFSIVVAMSTIYSNGFPARFSDSMNKKSEALLAAPDRLRGQCNEGPPTAPLPPESCILGRKDGRVNFLLVGDSHANHFSGFFDELGKQSGLRGYDMTQSGTAFLPGVERWYVNDGVLVRHKNFVLRNQYVSSHLKSYRYDTVVLAGNYSGYFKGGLRSGKLSGQVAFETSMGAAISSALEASPRVIIVTTIPWLDGIKPDCGLRAERFGKKLNCSFPIAPHRAETAQVQAFFKALKTEFPSVIWVEPDRVLCNATRCFSEMDGLPMYRNQGHLNDFGSRLLARKWIERFGNPLVADSHSGAADSP